MTGFLAKLSGDRRAGVRAWPAVTVVCLILLALLTVAQVAHVHPLDTDSDHCPLCIVMHAAVPVAVTAAIIVLVHIETRAPIVETRTVTRYWHPQLFTRPPPASCQGIFS